MKKEPWHPVNIPLEQLYQAQQKPASIKIGNKQLCLAFHEGKIWAVRSKCPHQGGPLQAGYLQEGTIVCPWHRFAFSLKTGQSESGGYFIETYDTKEEDGKLWVKIPKKRWLW